MPRKDVLHHPVLSDRGIPICRDCETVFTCHEAVIASAMESGLIDVAGLGAAFYPSDDEFVGSEVIRCLHPAVKSQSNEIVVQECEPCGATGAVADETCSECNGSGMIGFIPDGDGGWQKLRVSGATMAEVRDPSPQYSVKPATPLTDIEKMQRRGAFQNWLAMREATRPEGITEAS